MEEVFICAGKWPKIKMSMGKYKLEIPFYFIRIGGVLCLRNSMVDNMFALMAGVPINPHLIFFTSDLPHSSSICRRALPFALLAFFCSPHPPSRLCQHLALLLALEIMPPCHRMRSLRR